MFSRELEVLLASGTPPVVDNTLADWASKRLKYIQTNSGRIAVNLRRIYQQGVFKHVETVGF